MFYMHRLILQYRNSSLWCPNGKSSCPPKAVESQLMGPFPSQAKTTIISRQAFVYLDLFRPRLCGQVPKITGWHLPFIYKIITTLQSTISGANNYFLKIFLLPIYIFSIHILLLPLCHRLGEALE